MHEGGFDWARYHPLGYECSTAGDRRFSALEARLRDGRTIEEAYQLDIKGYRALGNDWRLGKGKPPIKQVDLWQEYLSLWRGWAQENPELMIELRDKASRNRILTDQFASTRISQARALAHILNEQMGQHYLCKFCLAFEGLKGSAVTGLPTLWREVADHIERVHNYPVCRGNETLLEATSRHERQYGKAPTNALDILKSREPIQAAMAARLIEEVGPILSVRPVALKPE